MVGTKKRRFEMNNETQDAGYYDSPKIAAAREALIKHAAKEAALRRERISKMKYKQLLPIPDKYIVLLFCSDGGYFDAEKAGWSVPFFILAEDAGESIIGVYAIDSIGEGQLETDFRLILKQPYSPEMAGEVVADFQRDFLLGA